MKGILVAAALLVVGLSGCTMPWQETEPDAPSAPAVERCPTQPGAGTLPGSYGRDEGCHVRQLTATAEHENLDADQEEEFLVCVIGQDNEGVRHPFYGTVQMSAKKGTTEVATATAKVKPVEFQGVCGAGAYPVVVQPPVDCRPNYCTVRVVATFYSTQETYEASARVGA